MRGNGDEDAEAYVDDKADEELDVSEGGLGCSRIIDGQVPAPKGQRDAQQGVDDLRRREKEDSAARICNLPCVPQVSDPPLSHSLDVRMWGPLTCEKPASDPIGVAGPKDGGGAKEVPGEAQAWEEGSVGSSCPCYVPQ